MLSLQSVFGDLLERSPTIAHAKAEWAAVSTSIHGMTKYIKQEEDKSLLTMATCCKCETLVDPQDIAKTLKCRKCRSIIGRRTADDSIVAIYPFVRMETEERLTSILNVAGIEDARRPSPRKGHPSRSTMRSSPSFTAT